MKEYIEVDKIELGGFEITTESLDDRRLRVELAGRAMQGILSNPEDIGMDYGTVIENAIIIANKMMEKLNG